MMMVRRGVTMDNMMMMMRYPLQGLMDRRMSMHMRLRSPNVLILNVCLLRISFMPYPFPFPLFHISFPLTCISSILGITVHIWL